MAQQTRRSFLSGSAAGVIAAGLNHRFVVASPNDKVVVGLIGCGTRGRRFFPHADFVCDPDSHRLAEAAKQAGLPESSAVSDMRRLFDNPAIDVVVIATPDHWHAPAALLAMSAGKHVYVEKPWSHNFRESQLLCEASRRYQRLVQHGTQSRSMPFARDAIAMLQDGVIGDVLMAKAWNVQRRPNIGHGKPSAPPPGVDYDLWVGPASMLPFQENRFHYNWHWWHNFGTGDIGNDGTHELDLARWGLGVDSLPSTVAALGGKYFYDDDQQFPDTATCLFEFPGDGKVLHRRQLMFEMRLWTENCPAGVDSGVEFYGAKGQMLFAKRGRLQIRGPENRIIKDERQDVSWEAEHLLELLEAIRGNRKLSAGVDEAHRSVALVHLANVALRTGRSLAVDPLLETVIDDDASSRLLSRTYRDNHWAVPDLA